MLGVKVLMLLCCIRGPLLAKCAQIHKNDRELLIEEPSKYERIDSHTEPVSLITVLSEEPRSKLFAQCKAQAASALVRFRQLNYPSTGNEYTRYVPSDAQLSNDLNWIKVSGALFNAVEECGSLANENDANMFQYDGTACRISNVRLSTSEDKCGDQTAEAVFVRTSCPEPAITGLDLTGGDNTISVSWTTEDDCLLASKYRVSWNGGSLDTLTRAAEALIERLSPCQTHTITVVALDGFDEPFGTSQTNSTTTNDADPVVSNVVVTALGIISFLVTWDLDDPCYLTKSFKGSCTSCAIASAPTTHSFVAGETARNGTVNLQECNNLVFTVEAKDGSGVILGSSESDPTARLHSANCDNGNYQEICSGCVDYQSPAATYDSAVTTCSTDNATLFVSEAGIQQSFVFLYFARNMFASLEEVTPKPFFIGLTKGDDGVWAWDSGSTDVFGWKGGKPGNLGGCAIMTVLSSFYYQDNDCNSPVDPTTALCYYK